MLDAGIQPREFRQFVQGPVPEVSHNLVQVQFNVHDVHQVAVLIQSRALEHYLHFVGVGMQEILRPPITPHQKMLGHETAFHCHGVHVELPD